MAKHTGITIRLGAMHDSVTVGTDVEDIVFDRAEMRKQGKARLQGELRRSTVEAWENERKRRSSAKQRDRDRKASRDAKRTSNTALTA